ncbi:histidine phosphatase family protein [Mucilaginibacter sp.]|uniref:histidine phosphatase family protein n=1 Tax=Mucilaginibacter sp. TaxID=1882438 RepID=UPI003D151EEA
MKKYSHFILLLFIVIGVSNSVSCQPASPLKIIIIRHGEKSAKGDNLSCQGLNRAMQLSKVIYSKFGIPADVYVPELNPGKSTTHVRMFQTISPFVIKYDLSVNSNYDVDDTDSLAKNLQKRTGTVLVVWEHKALNNIAWALGVKDKNLKWPADDYDSIWIVTYKNGNAVLTKDKEGIAPTSNCSF